VTRMLGASRGGHARHRQERASQPSLERFGPCAASSTQVEHSERKPGRAARGSQVTSAATRRCGQRNWHRLVPASSEAEASLACEDRAARTGVPARRLSVAEVGERRLGSEKHDPLAIGRVDGNQSYCRETAERWSSSGGFKSVDDRHRGGQAAEPGETRAGRSRERRGAEVFARWKALPIAFGACSFTREGKGAISAALGMFP